MRTTVAVAIVASALPGLLAMAPSGAPDADVVTEDLPAEVRVHRGVPGQTHVQRPERTLERIAIDTLDPRDPATLRRFVEALADRGADEDGTTASDTSPAAAPWFHARPGGDLDGDGLDDVLVAGHDPETDDGYAAGVRGLDGADLWRESSPDLVAGWPAGDLDGDGASDLYAVWMDVHDGQRSETCGADRCEETYTASFTWRLQARSGSDGQVRWQRSYDGTWRSRHVREETSTGWRTEWDLEVTSLAALPIPGGDHDGDGLADVIVNRLDLHERYRDEGEVIGEREGEHRLRGRTESEVLRGTDADLLFELGWEGPGLAELAVAPDLSGDGRHDLLWARQIADDDTWTCLRAALTEHCSDGSEHTTAFVVEALDGITWATLWSHRIDDALHGSALVLEEDLDGDAVADLYVLTDRPSDEGWGWFQRVVSGRDGTAAWEHEGLGGLFAVAPVGGLPGADLILSATTVHWELCWLPPPLCEPHLTASLVVQRLDGPTGELLSDTTWTGELPPADGVWFAFSFRRGDHDGDGVVDPSLSVGSQGAEDGDRSLAHVQSAVTGEMLYERDVEGFHATWPTADLDGNANDDLLVTAGDPGWASGQVRWSTSALALPQQQTLWTVGADDPTPWVAGDQDGRPGAELIRVVSDDGELLLQSLDGATLTTRWSRTLD